MDTPTTTTTDLAMTDISLHPRTSPPPTSQTKTAKIAWNEGLAFTFCCISVVLLAAGTSTTDWVESEGWKEGLFMRCVSVGAATPLPFHMSQEVGCGKVRNTSYLTGVAALVIIGFILNLFGTVLTGLGLRSTNPDKKHKYYSVAISAIIIALISLLIAAIVYPVMFSKDLANEPPNDGGVIEPKLHKRSLDFDNDGWIDSEDDDNDGIPDELDEDDDIDGVTDVEDSENDHSGEGYFDTDDDSEDEDDDGIPDLIIDNGDIPDVEEDDGVPDYEDFDYDGDGIPDDEDDDDDGDGLPDDEDDDDDNDGVPDDEDDDGVPDEEDYDDDNDGVQDYVDDDDNYDGVPDYDNDGDGIPDDEDDDDDGDGLPDEEDYDDDNDGVPDHDVSYGIQDYVDDDDNDGVPDNEDYDDDNDGVQDYVDDDDNYDEFPDYEDYDNDGDGIPDDEDDDDDADGIQDEEDYDDDNDGVPDHNVGYGREDYVDDYDGFIGRDRTYTFGFGYRVTWGCIILKFASAVLLICHRKSEESFYKERTFEKEDDGEA